jgi:hypothetical protein
METKHTPGPWRYQENSDAYTHIVRAGTDDYICGCGQGSDGTCEANARLIAAAPELLEALEEFVASRGASTDFARAYVKAEAVIRKAKGE